MYQLLSKTNKQTNKNHKNPYTCLTTFISSGQDKLEIKLCDKNIDQNGGSPIMTIYIIFEGKQSNII